MRQDKTKKRHKHTRPNKHDRIDEKRRDEKRREQNRQDERRIDET